MVVSATSSTVTPETSTVVTSEAAAPVGAKRTSSPTLRPFSLSDIVNIAFSRVLLLPTPSNGLCSFLGLDLFLYELELFGLEQLLRYSLWIRLSAQAESPQLLAEGCRILVEEAGKLNLENFDAWLIPIQQCSKSCMLLNLRIGIPPTD